jgi:kynurenine formamidase
MESGSICLTIFLIKQFTGRQQTAFKLDTAFNGTTPVDFIIQHTIIVRQSMAGTHLDAPVHFAKGKWAADEIPLEKLTGEAIVIDVSDKALKDADYLITVNDIEEWEKTNGKLKDDIILFFRTGYGAFYPDAKKYLGTDEKEPMLLQNFIFLQYILMPAEWLVKNRKIKAVGLDVASVDYGQSKDFKTHQILYGQNIPGFENVANLDKLPAKGAFVIALPMKIKGGSGGPLRIVAIISSGK